MGTVSAFASVFTHTFELSNVRYQLSHFHAKLFLVAVDTVSMTPRATRRSRYATSSFMRSWESTV